MLLYRVIIGKILDSATVQTAVVLKEYKVVEIVIVHCTNKSFANVRIIYVILISRHLAAEMQRQSPPADKLSSP